MWIDAHCHLASSHWNGSLGSSLERAKKAGISAWVQGGVDPSDWTAQQELQKLHGSAVILCFGLHPWWVAGQSIRDIEAGLVELEKKLPHASALGELGLDFLPKHGGGDSAQKQTLAFMDQLEILRAFPKPIVLHIVQAHDEALRILEKSGPLPAGGLVHSFSGGIEVARRYIALGLTLSVGGTAFRSKSLREAIPLLSPEALVIETDAPDQKPAGFDGERNELENLVPIAAEVAKLRGEDTNQLLDRSTATLKRIFGIGK